MYPKVLPDDRFWTREGSLKDFSDDVLLQFIRETSRLETSPGFPWILLGCPTVEQVLTRFPSQLCETVRETLRVRSSLSLEKARSLTPSELAQISYRALVRVFVKQEPHLLRKILAGRYRLIMNTSLTDIVCDRVVLEALANAEVDVWPTIPSKPGMGLDDDNVELLRKGMPDKWLVSVDAKAFDFHVAEWTMDAAASVEIQQYGVSETSELAHLIRASVVATCRKAWLLSTGHVFEQVDPGIQESGSRLTACRNSKIRVILGYLAGVLWIMAMGDDSVEQWPNGVFDPEGKYALFGHTMEVASLPADVEFEFCSHWFMRNGPAVPLGWAKTLFRLLSHAPDLDLLRQFKYEMRWLPKLPAIVDWLSVNWLSA